MPNIIEVDLCFEEYKDKTKKSIANYRQELQSMRVGRANPHILDRVMVDYYGTLTPINQIANITISEARVLTINVWDINAIKDVEKAIIAANIGIFPVNDGKVLRLVFPELNEERRRSLVKEVRALSEVTKVAIRNVRRDCIDQIRKLKKDSLITEDDLAYNEKEFDKLTSALMDDVDNITKAKEEEIMEI
ncbi:MAG: ribosome recycling factor [Christensenellales bacterium]|jgi:ribosome recycling factor|nr:ribosome recycling factor [Clostridiales bacterium]